MKGDGSYRAIRYRLEREQVWINADDISNAEINRNARFGEPRTLDRWFGHDVGRAFLRGVQAFSDYGVKDLSINDGDGVWVREKVAVEYARYIHQGLPDYLLNLSDEFRLTPITPLIDRIKSDQLDQLVNEFSGMIRQRLS